MSATTAGANKMTTTASKKEKKQKKALIQGKRRGPRSVYLKHERDFFRQMSRLESMDSYVLVSTLTASMSFGALLGFQPAVEVVMATASTSTPIHAHIYQALCSAIPVVAGLSAIFGLYATLMFSLTILYGKSTLYRQKLDKVE